ncbi:TOMM precursor leader peptide-binding protein [Arthrobacter woluwensis]|uniref:TOMM precursor leader peptide-binding protein n=1 Tax=Arthrobacter woluwensis TaxID=156980 RepID=UPI00164389E5|nr:TOMM precursor leader peptide-binding protein [Arthrobacter woluwensis]
MSSTYVIAEGVRQADFEDSFVLVLGSSIVRFRQHQELAKELFGFLSKPRTLDEVTRGVPGLSGQERLLNSLRSAGVVRFHNAAGDRLPGLPRGWTAADPVRVRLDVPSDLEERVRENLRAFGSIQIVDEDDGEPTVPVLVVRTTIPDAVDVCRSLWANDVCHVPVVPFDGAKLFVGPAVLPGTTACFECLVIRRAASTAWPDEYLRYHGAAAPAPIAARDLDLGVQLAARLIERAFYDEAHDLIGSCSVFNPESLTLYNSRVWSVPRCPSCSKTARSSTSYPWLAPAPSEAE